MHRLKKFFDTFGYVVIRNCINEAHEELINAEFDSNYLRAKKEIKKGENSVIVDALEYSPETFKILQESPVFDFVRLLIGHDSIYWASDFQRFHNQSVFHKDLNRNPSVLKVAFYLQAYTQEDGGDFILVPGTHLRGNPYSDGAVLGLNWPNGGGYNNNHLLSEVNVGAGVLQGNLNIPSVSIKLNYGDLLLFDVALVHSVNSSNKLRRMIAINFLKGFSECQKDAPTLTLDQYLEEVACFRVADYLSLKFQGTDSPTEFKKYSDVLLNSASDKFKPFLVPSPDNLIQKFVDLIKTPDDAKAYISGAYKLHI
jgi:ectoine hydroxylase-related dioxygenase (phytanoyl-CoA dioxygenase family)